MATDSSGVAGLAGRYATALFELAVEAKAVEAVAGDLVALKALLADNADLQRLVRSPVLSRGEQTRAVLAILDRAGANDLTRRFVGLLAERRRLFILTAAIDAFESMLAEYRGEVRAEITSARALSGEQLGRVEALLRKVIGGRVVVDAGVDEDLVGGLVVRVGSRMVDVSLRTKLQRLQLAMKGVG